MAYRSSLRLSTKVLRRQLGYGFSCLRLGALDVPMRCYSIGGGVHIQFVIHFKFQPCQCNAREDVQAMLSIIESPL